VGADGFGQVFGFAWVVFSVAPITADAFCKFERLLQQLA
jgi:hypothetical protein